MIQELDVQKIRKDFPMLQNQNLIYLDSSATSQKPYSVIRAVTDFMKTVMQIRCVDSMRLRRMQQRNMTLPEKKSVSLFMQKAQKRLFLQEMQQKA